jgi:hypothetical protein
LLLLVFFTGFAVSLDFLFQIKDETIPRPVESSTPAPPKLAPTQPLESVASSDNSGFEMTPVLGILAVIAFINWFVFMGVSIYLGGDPIGILPSQDGFILKSHGHHTVVSEPTWVFSLYYSAATLLLSPAIVFLLIAKQFWLHRRELRTQGKLSKWYVNLFVCVFLVAWCIGWFGGIGSDFLKSRADWLRLKHSTTESHPAP